jgi:hypothetical protein
MSAQHSPSLESRFILLASTAAIALFACHRDADRTDSHSPPASSAAATPAAGATANNQNHLAATYRDPANDLELANAGAGGGHSGHHKGKGGSGGTGTGTGGGASE